jgi:hypothetical protein
MGSPEGWPPFTSSLLDHRSNGSHYGEIHRILPYKVKGTWPCIGPQKIIPEKFLLVSPGINGTNTRNQITQMQFTQVILVLDIGPDYMFRLVTSRF